MPRGGQQPARSELGRVREGLRTKDKKTIADAMLHGFPDGQVLHEGCFALLTLLYPFATTATTDEEERKREMERLKEEGSFDDAHADAVAATTGAGGIPAALRAIEWTGQYGAEVFFRGCWLLRTLFEFDHAVSEALEAGVAAKVVRRLGSPEVLADEVSVGTALCIMRDMTSAKKGAPMCVAEAGGVAAALRCMATHRGDDAVSLHGTCVLANLICMRTCASGVFDDVEHSAERLRAEEGCVAEVMAGGGVALFASTALAHLHNEEIVGNCLLAIANLVYRKGVVGQAQQDTALQTARAAMEAHPGDSNIQNWGCAIIANLCYSRGDKAGLAVARAGGVALVFAALNAHPKDPGVLQRGCGALGRLAQADHTVLADVVQRGGIGAVIRGMGRLKGLNDDNSCGFLLLVAQPRYRALGVEEGGGLEVHADGSLTIVVEEVDKGLAERVVAEGGVKALLRAYRHASRPSVKQTAAAVLEKLSEQVPSIRDEVSAGVDEWDRRGEKRCAQCGQTAQHVGRVCLFRCKNCTTEYCSPECQRAAWGVHRHDCRAAHAAATATVGGGTQPSPPPAQVEGQKAPQ